MKYFDGTGLALLITEIFNKIKQKLEAKEARLSTGEGLTIDAQNNLKLTASVGGDVKTVKTFSNICAYKSGTSATRILDVSAAGTINKIIGVTIWNVNVQQAQIPVVGASVTCSLPVNGKCTVSGLVSPYNSGTTVVMIYYY